MVLRHASRSSLSLDSPLRGRDEELGQLVLILDRARDGVASCLAVQGAPGQGKTKLLDQACARAREDGFIVLSTVGREVLVDLVFAGLSGIIRPLLGLLDELPPTQADVLRGALGLEDFSASELAVGNATLTLLARASEYRPVLVVVDDAHWVDRASLSTLLFVAHQFEAERISLVFGCRTGESDQLTQAALPSIELTDLDEAGARALLVDQDASVEIARRCWQLSGGNPLALLEGFVGLTPAQRAGTADMPPILPMGDRLLEAFTRQLSDLSPPTLSALAVAAVDTTGELGVISRAVSQAGANLQDLFEAETAGIIDIADNRLAWRHPLLRAAIHLGASPQRLRAAHRCLADTLPPAHPEERRLWHLAQSTIGQDEAIAARLSTAAESAARRGALPAAAAAYLQAAQLSPDDEQAQQRLLRAAVCQFSTGEIEAGAQQLRQLLERASDPRFAAEVADVLGRAEMWLVGPVRARRLLEHHAVAVAATAPRLSAVLHLRAAVAGLIALDPDRAVIATASALEAAQASGDMDATMGAWAVHTLMASFAGDTPDTAAHVETLEQVMAIAVAALDRAQSDGVDVIAQLSAYALIIHDHPDPAQRALHQVMQFANSSGQIGMGVQARFFRADALWRQGRWNDALAEINQAVTMQEASGLHLLIPLAKAVAARFLAGLGRAEDCEAYADEALAVCVPVGLDLIVAIAHSARGLLHLGAGRFDQAADALEKVAALCGHLRQSGWLWWRADLVEALHFTGRRREALAMLAALEDTAPTDVASWASGARRRCRGLLAVGQPDEDYSAALEIFGAIGAPFEAARTLLLRGNHRLHSGGDPAGYRDLAEARSVFDRLGARDWTERASTAGDDQHEGAVALSARLTKKELPVALLVGNGATDREVANELFISVKTVGYHLGNIYTKLGLRNRTHLATLVAAEAANAPG